MKSISIGGENFIELRKTNSYYVDKTELLYDLFYKTNNKVTLFTRPRRFGKTLTMSMMESFFNIKKKKNRAVFDGLSIMNHPEFCREYMNEYPVLFLSFKDVEGLDFASAFKMLKTVIADLCKQYVFLMQDSRTDKGDREIFERLWLKETEDIDEIKNALKTIMRMMNAVYGKQIILLIDEYDVPLSKANAGGYYARMLDLIRGLMSASLKTNDYLKFAVITGCLRIPKESIFTRVNNFASYSVLEDRFSGYFGFTEPEVEKILEDFDLEDKETEIREWYDGYSFGGTQVYCPWDVVNYISALSYNRNARPQNYWENTSGNEAIREFFKFSDTDITGEFETLLDGGVIYETVTNTLTYDRAYKSIKGLWSILLMTGYVTTVSESADKSNSSDAFSAGTDQENQTVALRIPNREIAGIFRTAVVNHFNETVDTEQIRALMDALWDGDEASATEILSDLLWNTISYMDYSEDYYHAFLAGIFVGRGGYSVQSNKERGLGRPDIDLRDRKNRRAIIIEAKISESKGRMEYWCDEAIGQIVRNGYAKGLEEDYKEVLCYGVAFYKKSALVKKYH